jgi:inward rectifier potassium channel
MANSKKENNQDLGLDRSGQKNRQRVINEDGTYNMEKVGGQLIGNRNFYHWIITTTWKKYLFTVLGFYTIMNIIFATGYYLIGVDELNGMQGETQFNQWLYCFFFSAQSFTTVGYGGISPIGEAANFLAVSEALVGLMTFALATGTLFGRFSKPISKIRYSKNFIINKYQNGLGLQFMVANELRSNLLELEAKVNISWLETDANNNSIRKFDQLELEIDKIAMFPTSWTINHPITEGSILYGKTYEEIKNLDIEVFVLIKGFDDAFSQTIYSRYSYMYPELIWGAKFKRPFYYNENGKIIMDLNKVGEWEKVDLP